MWPGPGHRGTSRRAAGRSGKPGTLFPRPCREPPQGKAVEDTTPVCRGPGEHREAVRSGMARRVGLAKRSVGGCLAMARVRAEGARAVGNFRRPCHPKGPKELSFLKGARVNTQDLTRKRPRRRLSLPSLSPGPLRGLTVPWHRPKFLLEPFRDGMVRSDPTVSRLDLPPKKHEES